MISIKLNIQVQDDQPGTVVELEDRIARHFISKGWGVEDIPPEPIKKKPKK